MKTLKTMILTAGAVAVLGASGLYAQTRATADIPFDFTAQNTAMPAGTYTMTSASASKDLMLIRNVKDHKAILVLAPGSEKAYRGTQDKNVVVFHRVGERYFLADVKTDAVCGHVSPSKLERELASDGNGSMAAVIVPALSAR